MPDLILSKYSLNKEAARILQGMGEVPMPGRAAISDLILVAWKQRWSPNGDRDDVLLREITRVEAARNAEDLAWALQPFLAGPTTMEELASNGYPPLGPETLEIYTSEEMSYQAEQCQTPREFMNMLEDMEAWVYEVNHP